MRVRLLKFAVVCATIPVFAAGAQSIPGAVLAKNEPHHHPAYEDSTLRVLRVSVPGKDTTLLHEHAVDYFWIALGPSAVINARQGQPDATITSADLSVHYTVGKFAHVARNPGAGPFNNITVELLQSQGQVTNRCEEAVANQTMVCTSAAGMRDDGVLERPAFETGKIVVSLVTVDPAAVIKGASRKGRSWFITLSVAEAVSLRIDGAGTAPAGAGRGGRAAAPASAWVGGTWRAPAGGIWTMKNTGTRAIQVLEVEPRP